MGNVDIKAVAFDVDGTLIDSHVWEELHVLFGLSREDNARMHGLYVNGISSFHEVTDLMAEMYLKKVPRVTREQADVVFKNFRLLPGTRETVEALSKKYPLAVISSGLVGYVENVAKALHIPLAYSYTSFLYSPDGIFSGVAYNEASDELQAKVNALKDFGAKVGAKPEEIAFVGDSINDIEGFRYTGRGILVGEGTEELRRAAWKQVDALPEVLGIL
ncbi:HAD-IB family phosphatase [Patescibacteria group bacterium]|nr:HAD-IB family phosphatase [Patescibacteria group bacterium]